MDKVTLREVYNKVVDLENNVKEMRTGKVSQDIYKKDLEIIQEKIDDIRKDLANINSYAKWAVLLIGGAIITAIINLIIGNK